jgi:hypothetical protein
MVRIIGVGFLIFLSGFGLLQTQKGRIPGYFILLVGFMIMLSAPGLSS